MRLRSIHPSCNGNEKWVYDQLQDLRSRIQGKNQGIKPSSSSSRSPDVFRIASSMPIENILPSYRRQTPIIPLQSAVTVDAAHVACLAGPKPGVSFDPGLVVEPFRGGTCKRAR
jgi:hypothetical protein